MTSTGGFRRQTLRRLALAAVLLALASCAGGSLGAEAIDRATGASAGDAGSSPAAARPTAYSPPTAWAAWTSSASSIGWRQRRSPNGRVA